MLSGLSCSEKVFLQDGDEPLDKQIAILVLTSFVYTLTMTFTRTSGPATFVNGQESQVSLHEGWKYIYAKIFHTANCHAFGDGQLYLTMCIPY